MSTILPGLANRHAVITGASQGIGEGIARFLAAHDMVVTIGHEPNRPHVRRAQRVTRDICSASGNAIALPLDLSDLPSVQYFLHRAWRRQPIDVLVNNAFWWSKKQYENHTWQHLEHFAMVDFVGTNALTLGVLKRMRRTKIQGSVINITSVHQETVRRLHPFYSALKAALAMMTQELAVEYGPYGIRVNAVAPGQIETRPTMVRRSTRARNRYVPLRGRSGLPADIANAVAFLASDELAGHITGITLFVDGAERLFAEWVDRIRPGS